MAAVLVHIFEPWQTTRTRDTIVAHGVIPDLTYDGYDYFASLLIDIDSGLFNQRKDTKL